MQPDAIQLSAVHQAALPCTRAFLPCTRAFAVSFHPTAAMPAGRRGLGCDGSQPG